MLNDFFCSFKQRFKLGRSLVTSVALFQLHEAVVVLYGVPCSLVQSQVSAKSLFLLKGLSIVHDRACFAAFALVLPTLAHHCFTAFYGNFLNTIEYSLLQVLNLGSIGIYSTFTSLLTPPLPSPSPPSHLPDNSDFNLFFSPHLIGR